MRRAFYTTAALAAVALGVCWQQGPQQALAEKPKTPAKPSAESRPSDEATDPIGANGACYVCHMTFIKEELAKVHLKAKVGCVKCHGLSAKHANDENIGATKPDITFKRKDVDAACQKCHEGHNVAAKKVIARYLDRHLPAGSAPICTDCHGTHKIERTAEK